MKLKYHFMFMILMNMAIGYNLNDIKYCPSCKICRDMQCFRSLNKNKYYNNLCRRFLNSTSGYKKKHVVIRVLNASNF